MKFFEKLNKKSKGEQFFIIILLFTAIIGLFCITGCGGKSCEKPDCGGIDDPAIGKVVGCSIPGCGGCLGNGCNSACWPQSVKLVGGSINQSGSGNQEALKIAACDTRYYGGGCLGCGQREKSCYSGCIKAEDKETNMNGFFYGSSASDEKIIGCADGCGGCVASGGTGAYSIHFLESYTGID